MQSASVTAAGSNYVISIQWWVVGLLPIVANKWNLHVGLLATLWHLSCIRYVTVGPCTKYDLSIIFELGTGMRQM